MDDMRLKKAFQQLPSSLWTLFDDADELPGDILETSGCAAFA